VNRRLFNLLAAVSLVIVLHEALYAVLIYGAREAANMAGISSAPSLVGYLSRTRAGRREYFSESAQMKARQQKPLPGMRNGD
jgi:hypothetical protein